MECIIFFLLFNVPEFYSQGVFTVNTNKSNYYYGEIIEVNISIFNNTDSTIVFHPECEYPIRVRVKGVDFIEMGSLADGCERHLKPGECETWKFQLDPSKLGFPVSAGEQVIYGAGYNHLDSVKITAPKYYGGIIEVQFNYLIEKDKRDKLFNDLNANVITRDTIESQNRIIELWSIQNRDIDSIVSAHYGGENRFGYVDTYRFFEQGIRTVTSVNGKELLPKNYLLMQNYPNPFNPSTTISYQLPSAGYVALKVYDALGREVATLVDEYKQSGEYSAEFRVQNVELTSRVYFYALRVQDSSLRSEYFQTKKMLLIK